MIDIKDWESKGDPEWTCDNCGKCFAESSGLFHEETEQQVCSWRCAELFTADYNSGEAERSIEQ